MTNEDQHALWNGPAGQNWVREQSVLDSQYAPFETILADAAAQLGAHRVLDVGCGAGATTLAIARRLGPGADVLGVDISAPLIERAASRAAQEASPARFELADAQTHVFDAGRFDLVVSRFGVMFFGDPVAAFANLRFATREGGALACLVFRSPLENAFMTTAERAAAPLLPALPPRQPNAPGQFAFADATRVTQILQSAGWTDVELARLDVPCVFPEADLENYFSGLGPVGLALRNADAPTRARVIETVRAAFTPFVDGNTVRFVAACWLIRGTAARSG